MTEFHYTLGDDGVAIITWDVPEKSMNVMTMAGWDELESLIDRALGDDAVKGYRLRIFAEPAAIADAGFLLNSVEATLLCSRGVTDDGLCV